MWKNPRGRPCGSRQHLSPGFPQSFRFLSLSSWFPSLNSLLIPIPVFQLCCLLISWSSTRSLFYSRQKERGKEQGHNPHRTFPELIPEYFSFYLIGYFFCKVSLILFFLFLETLLQQSYKSRGGGETAFCKATCISAQNLSMRTFCSQLLMLWRREQDRRLQSATDVF